MYHDFVIPGVLDPVWICSGRIDQLLQSRQIFRGDDVIVARFQGFKLISTTQAIGEPQQTGHDCFTTVNVDVGVYKNGII